MDQDPLTALIVFCIVVGGGTLCFIVEYCRPMRRRDPSPSMLDESEIDGLPV